MATKEHWFLLFCLACAAALIVPTSCSTSDGWPPASDDDDVSDDDVSDDDVSDDDISDDDDSGSVAWPGGATEELRIGSVYGGDNPKIVTPGQTYAFTSVNIQGDGRLEVAAGSSQCVVIGVVGDLTLDGTVRANQGEHPGEEFTLQLPGQSGSESFAVAQRAGGTGGNNNCGDIGGAQFDGNGGGGAGHDSGYDAMTGAGGDGAAGFDADAGSAIPGVDGADEYGEDGQTGPTGTGLSGYPAGGGGSGGHRGRHGQCIVFVVEGSVLGSGSGTVDASGQDGGDGGDGGYVDAVCGGRTDGSGGGGGAGGSGGHVIFYTNDDTSEITVDVSAGSGGSRGVAGGNGWDCNGQDGQDGDDGADGLHEVRPW